MSPAGARFAVTRRVVAAAAALAVLWCSVPAPAFASKTVGISSPKFEFSVAPGQTGTGELYLINDGTEPIKVMVYTANQKTDAKGQITYDVPRVGTAGNQGPAAWFRIQMPEDSKAIGNTPYVDLDPGQRVLVKFIFQVPPGVPAGDHQVLVFFEMFDFAQGGGMLSTVSGRIGTRIRLRVQGTLVEKVSVQPFSARWLVIGDLVPWSFVVRNDGNVDKSVTARLEVLDGNEEVLQGSRVMSETVIYATSMSERAGTLRLKGLRLGRYTVRLTAAYPREPDAQGRSVPSEIVKEREIWVFPLWLVIVVVGIVGALALWLSWRGAVRAAQRKAQRQRPGRRAGAGGRARGVDPATVEPIRSEPVGDAEPLASDQAGRVEPLASEPADPRARAAASELWSEDEADWE